MAATSAKTLITKAYFAAAMALPGYNIPLRFEAKGSGVQTELRFDYDLTQQSSLQFGSLEFSAKTVRAQILPGLKLQAFRAKGIEASQNYLLLEWPQELLSQGTLEIVNRGGKVLHSLEFDEKELSRWAARFPQKAKAPTWGIKIDAGNAEWLSGFGALRFCWIGFAKDPSQRLRFCSGSYELITVRNLKRLSLFPTSYQARVIINGQAKSLQDNFLVEPGDAISFFAETNTGISVDIAFKAQPLNLIELLQEDDGSLRIMAWGPFPLQNKYEIVDNEEEGFLSKYILWKDTIGDFRTFWQTRLPSGTKSLFFNGPEGGILRHDFAFDRLPTEADRPWLYHRSPTGTYVNSSKLYLAVNPGVEVKSEENEIEKLDEDYRWRFRAEDRGEINRAHVDLITERGSFKAYYELYKGFPGEISLRLGGLAATNKLILQGEGSFNYWFESILGWSNSFLSKHRWGVSANYIQTLSNAEIGTLSYPITYQVYNLKYRLTPGLWNRESTWGIFYSSSDFTFGNVAANFSGGGIFWARSMPKLFDELFNLLIFLRYPKWVDLELVYYPTVTGTHITGNDLGAGLGNWGLNFHGKVLWTKRFFGEVGFGVRQLDLTQNINDGVTLTQRIQLTSYYGTVGLGLNF